MWSFADLLLAFYFHEVLHLEGVRTGQLLFALLIFGALCDVGVGVALTYFRAGWRGILLIHFLGSIATAVTLFGQFNVDSQPVGLLLLSGMLFRLAYALYDVPQTALTSLLPVDDSDARRYVRLRTTLSAVARLAVTGANLGLAQLSAAIFDGSENLVLLIFGIAIVATSASLFRVASGVERRRETPKPAGQFEVPPGLARLLLAFVVAVAFFPTLSRLLIFIPSTDTSPYLGAWLLFAFCIGTVLGPTFALKAEDAAGTRGACVLSVLLAVLSGDLLALFPHTALPLSAVIAVAYGTGLGAVGALLWEAVTRLVISHAATTGQRADAMVFGLVIFSIQVSIAIGSLVLGELLEGFRQSDDPAHFWTAAITTGSGLLTVALLLGQSTLSQKTAVAAA